MCSRWRCQIAQQSAGSPGGVLASPTQPVSGHLHARYEAIGCDRERMVALSACLALSGQ
jgi:hypothetical protein